MMADQKHEIDRLRGIEWEKRDVSEITVALSAILVAYVFAAWFDQTSPPTAPPTFSAQVRTNCDRGATFDVFDADGKPAAGI